MLTRRRLGMPVTEWHVGQTLHPAHSGFVLGALVKITAETLFGLRTNRWPHCRKIEGASLKN
jgi:hypothetical protein